MFTVTATTAKGKDTEKSVTFEVDLGDNLQDAIGKFGEAVVYDNYIDSAVIAAQATARVRLSSEKHPQTPEQVVTSMADWKPSTGRQRSDGSASLVTKILKLTPEARAKLIAELTAKANA